MTGGIVLGIGLCFHNHAPQQTSIRLAFHQPAAHQVRSNNFGRAAEEGAGQGWEVLGDGMDGYGSGLQLKDLSSMFRKYLITGLLSSPV